MQMQEKFELQLTVRLSTLSDKQKNLLCHLIHRWNAEQGYAFPTTAELAKVIGVTDSKNARRTMDSAKLPDSLVTIKEVPGSNNQYFLNFEAIKELAEREVRTNYTPRTRKQKTLLTSEDKPSTPENMITKPLILTTEEGTLLTFEEVILTTEEPNGYNDYSNDYKDDDATLTSSSSRSGDLPLSHVNAGSAVVPPSSLVSIEEGLVDLDNDVDANESQTLLTSEDNDEIEWEDVEVDETEAVEETVSMQSHTVASKFNEYMNKDVWQFSTADITVDNVLFCLEYHHSKSFVYEDARKMVTKEWLAGNKYESVTQAAKSALSQADVW